MWITVAQLSDLNQIQSTRVEADGEYFALFRDGEQVFALRDVCSHAEVPLSLGTYDAHSKQVHCPQHGAKFDVITGKALSMPAVTGVRTAKTRVVNGEVQLEVED